MGELHSLISPSGSLVGIRQMQQSYHQMRLQYLDFTLEPPIHTNVKQPSWTHLPAHNFVYHTWGHISVIYFTSEQMKAERRKKEINSLIK